MSDYSKERERMVERQLAARGIIDPAVLDAMRTVPREGFVPMDLRAFAYDDEPLPIAESQTISQPFMVASMIVAARIRRGDRVLEIGAGSGYAATVMAQMGAVIHTIERHPKLANAAREHLRAHGFRDVEVRTGDGTLGLPEAAPFDAIVASACGPAIPPPWREQLTIGGRLVMPVGGCRRHQRLVRLTRRSVEQFGEEDIGEVAFVPLVGAHGFATAGRSRSGRPPNPV